MCGDGSSPASALVQAGGLLEQLPDGYALVDTNEHVVWCNSSLKRLAGRDTAIEGASFFDVFGPPEILGPDYTPFNTALATNEAARPRVVMIASRRVDCRMGFVR